MDILRIFRVGKTGVSASLVLLMVVELMGVAMLSLLFAPNTTQAAAVTIDTTASVNQRSDNNTGSQTVFISDVVGYVFYRDSTGQCVYRKTTDAGDTWSGSIIVDSQTDCIRISVWYDQWTPGDSGADIHILTMDTSTDSLFYNRLNTTADTLLLGSSPVNITSNSGQTPTFSVSVNISSITKSTDGEIFVTANDTSDSYVVSCTGSCDSPTNWSEVGTNPLDLRNDYSILQPLAGGSVMLINRDISANILRSKIWNGSSWSASWELIEGSLVESPEYDAGISAAVNLLNGYIYVAYVTDNNVLTDNNDDIRTAVYDGSAWTTMSDVITNATGRGVLDVATGIDQNNGHVYVAYTIQDTGGDPTTANIYYRESTNGMTSWGPETGPINAVSGDIRKPSLDPSNAQRLYVTWGESTVDDRFGATLANIGPDTQVAFVGTSTPTVFVPDTEIESGVTLRISSLQVNTLSSITITETGTVDAGEGLTNVSLFYDLDVTAPYDCQSEAYDGTETQFGATDPDGFSGANGTSTFSGGALSIGPASTFCGYIVYDTTPSATDGSTIIFSINDPVSDVVVTGSDPFPESTVQAPGTTSVISPDLTLTRFHWRNDDGSELTATSRTGGIEDEAVASLGKSVPIRLRMAAAAAGSTSTTPIAYTLEYTQAAATCGTSGGWTRLATSSDAFAMFDSSNLVDGTNATNIGVVAGGVSDDGRTFVGSNAGIKDTSDQTDPLVLDQDQFTEFEFSIVATAFAVEGTTYCFRLSDDGEPLGKYDTYPQLTINADITASSTGVQISTVDIPSSATYFGGSFLIRANDAAHTVTSITVTETGTIDAGNNIASSSLFYDLDVTAPYDCQSEAYDGTETQFGATDPDGFSGANGTSTFTDSISISTIQSLCVYTVADILSSTESGETIQFSIASAVDDIEVGGASVSPSEPVVLSGTTTAVGAELAQTGYHWRDDDGSVTTASSLSAGVSNTPVTDFAISTPVRLRLAVSNDGATTSQSVTYKLEYAEQVSTCALASGWSTVGSVVDGEWDTFDSDNLTDGQDTTDIAESVGGVSNPNSSFVGTSGVRTLTASSAPTSLADDQFLELEYSLQSTPATNYGATYCFRLTANGAALDRYDNYPVISIAPKRDYFTQNGTTVISGTTAVITAGVDYEPPATSSTAFIRITNTHHTGAGEISGGGSQDVEEVTAYIVNPDNLSNSITFSRDRNLNETYINWEIVEFIGKPGTDNEMIVRSNNTASMSTAATEVNGATVAVNDPDDVVVFITGIAGNETGNDFFSTQVTAAWDATSSRPVFTREATSFASVDISYSVVEFTGINWSVQRVEHTYSAAGVTETQTITPVNSLSRTFLHTQKRVGDVSLVGSHGHEVFISSIGAVSFALSPDADMSVSHVSVAWIIENLQTGVGAMAVERQSGVTRNGPEPITISVTLSDTLSDTSNASIFGNSSGDGTNNAHPRSIAGLRIASSTSYEIWRSDTGANLRYRTEIVQWPVANLAYRQNYYRFYTDNNLLTPSDPWPAGPAELGENTSITADDNPPGLGDVLRLRMTIQARNANWPENFTQFKLQYAERVTTCTAVAVWNDVGSNASSSIWRGFSATGTVDGTVLSSDPPTPGDLLISVADVAGNLAHQNNTATNTYLAFDGEDVEFDWYLQHNGAAADTVYCFRMTLPDGDSLSGYLQYPQVRTADFTPVVKDWRWYTDPSNETPSTAAAAVNSAPSAVAASTSLALRVVVPEDKSVTANDVKFRLQFSQDPNFDTVVDVSSTSTCSYDSVWCYAEGAVPDNTTISTALIGTSDSCIAGSGSGCGTHNSNPDFVVGHTHTADDVQEYSFTIQSTQIRPNAVYYFRLYDLTRARAVVPLPSASYPSVVGEGAALSFTVSGLPAGTTTAGLILDATTTPAGVDFGSLPVGTDVAAGQRISIDTNATEGYRVWKFSSQELHNGSGVTIPAISSTNASPAAWSLACTATSTGCVGYHTTDATLGGGSARFAAVDTYAALSSTPAEVLYSSLPANESHDIVYRVSVTEAQPAGTYQTDITYIATPVH